MSLGGFTMAPLVRLQKLRKEYYELVAVHDVDLEVPAGEIFGMIGPNGAGKTTALRMMATTLEATSGRVYFDGEDVWTRPCRYRANLGLMPDFFQMYPGLKVGELLRYFAMAHGLRGRKKARRVDEVLARTGLEEKRDKFVRGLSRGMVQRLGLARAILHRPRLLLLDEPASGLDPLARRTLFDILRRVREDGATILISSHILAELSGLCTSVGIMHHGRFLATGATEEIARKVTPRRRIELRLVEGTDSAVNLLSARDDVYDLQREQQTLRFDFEGGDAALAALNAALIDAGASAALLQERQTDLGELYFAIAAEQDDASTA